MNLDHLQCPFTWKSRLLPEVERIHRVDKLPLAPSVWAKVLLKLSLAYTDYRNSNYERASMLMAECYMPLLPFGLENPGSFDTGCQLVRDYSVALKHILDSTWAFLRLQTCCDDGDEGSLRDLREFVASISSYKEMDNKQKAAVLVIRASLSKAPKNLELIRKAIALDEKEGQWHCALGKLLLLNRIPKTAHFPGRPPSQEEIRALGEAYRLRKDPESCTLLSESWLDNGPNGHSMAAAIIRSALRVFPDSASVQARAARVLWLLPSSELDLREVEACYRRSLEIAGECLFLRFKLGGLCVILDKLHEAREHYEKAAAIYPEAAEVLTSLNRLPILRAAKARLLQQQQCRCPSRPATTTSASPAQQQQQQQQEQPESLRPFLKDSDSGWDSDSSSGPDPILRAPSNMVERKVNSVTEVTCLTRLPGDAPCHSDVLKQKKGERKKIVL